VALAVTTVFAVEIMAVVVLVAVATLLLVDALAAGAVDSRGRRRRASPAGGEQGDAERGHEQAGAAPY